MHNPIFILKKHYNLSVLFLQNDKSGLVNNVFIVQTQYGKYVLKQYIKSTLQDIIYEVNITNYLVKHAFFTPKIIKTIFNEHYCVENCEHYVLFEYIENKQNRNVAIKKYTTLYSHFSKLLTNIELENRANWCPLYNCQWIKTLENKSLYPKLLKQLELYEFKLKKIYNLLPRSLVHGDLKKDNILISTRNLYLIDFGNARNEARCFDVIHLADSISNNQQTISIKHFAHCLKLFNIACLFTEHEKYAMIWMLIIHKITEVMFYSQKNKSKTHKIRQDINFLIKNEHEFLRQINKELAK